MPNPLRAHIAATIAAASGLRDVPAGAGAALFADWPRTRQLAADHRVLGMLAMAVLDTPNLRACVPVDDMEQLGVLALGNRRDQRAAQDHLRAISALFSKEVSGPIVIKGAVSQLAGIFADPAHRWLADLDIVVTDPAQVQAFAADYTAPGEPGFDPAGFTAEQAAIQARSGHHLPYLRTANRKQRVELHLSPVHRNLMPLVPEGWTRRSRPIAAMPPLRQPAPRDHLILTLIHALYGDRYSDNIRFRLRNMLDAYLQFQRLTPEDQAAVQAHFQRLGCSADWAYWRYVCAVDFGAERPDECPIWRYEVQTRLLDRKAVRAARYGFFFTLRTLPKALFSKQDRSRLLRKAASPDARKIFLNKLRRIFGAS